MLYEWSVKVADGEIRDLVLDGRSQIRYGRTTADVQPEPTSATLTMLTYDAAPQLFANRPSYILNPNVIPTGFTTYWSDVYEGVDTVLTVGARVQISIAGQSGFTAEWVDIYTGGLAQSTRFDGHIVSLDYRPGEVQLTAATKQENLGRVIVGAEGYPAQTDADRVKAISEDALVDIQVQPGTDQNLIAQEVESERTAWTALQRIARDTGGLLYSTREGRLQYRQLGSYTPKTVSVDPLHTLVDPLLMSLDISRIANQVQVQYGERDPETGKRPTVNSSNAPMVDELGQRQKDYILELADEADAQARADWRTSLEPLWEVGTVQVFLKGASKELQDDIANLELGDVVTLPQLLPGGPVDTYNGYLLGYTETISADEWAFNLHLTPWDWNGV